MCKAMFINVTLNTNKKFVDKADFIKIFITKQFVRLVSLGCSQGPRLISVK